MQRVFSASASFVRNYLEFIFCKRSIKNDYHIILLIAGKIKLMNKTTDGRLKGEYGIITDILLY